MKKKITAGKPVMYIAGIYCGTVLFRYVLALCTSAYPMVNIDEFLYYGIARSIAEGKGLMFRGQPTDYSYILYPLILSPVYLLGFSGPLLYRMLQLWNILLSSLSVFPLYGIAKHTVGDEKRAIPATAVCMLLPDFMLGQTMMSENIILPLFFTLFYLFLRCLRQGRTRDMLCIGAAGGLLFSAKPGAVIPSVVICLVLLIRGIRTKASRQILMAVCSMLLTAAVSAAFFGMAFLLNGRVSFLSVYQSQIENGEHLNVFFRFIGIYILYFILAGGIGCIAVAFRNRRSMTAEQKTLFHAAVLSLLLMIIGVSWSVNRYEYNANLAHMRYIGMYIPLFYLFALIRPAEAAERRRLPAASGNPAPWIVLLMTAALLVLGIYAGVNSNPMVCENMTFAVIIAACKNHLSAWIVSAAVLLAIALWAWILRRKGQQITCWVSLSLAVCMLVNGTAAYATIAKDTRFESVKQTGDLMRHVDPDDEILYLYTVETTTSYYGALDVFSRKGITYAKLNDMFNYLYQTKGVYQPFLPQGQRGNIPAEMTPDTDTLVMDATVYCVLKLAEENTVHYAENEDALHLVKIADRTKPWLDAVIGNTTNTILAEGEKGILLIFNERYLQSPCTMTFRIRCNQPAKLSMYSNAEYKTIELEPGLHEYEMTFDHPMDAYNFMADAGDIRLYGFDLAN